MESYGFSSKVRLCLLKMKVDVCRKNAVLMFKQPGKEKQKRNFVSSKYNNTNNIWNAKCRTLET